MLPFCNRSVNVPRSKYLPSCIRGVRIQTDEKSLGRQLRRHRLKLKIFQVEAARRMKVSNRTLSLWECDRLSPTWFYWPRIVTYLGFDPFGDSTLGRPKGNETHRVANLSPRTLVTLGQKLFEFRMNLRKTRCQLAAQLDISAKTIWNWESDRRRPSRSKIAKFKQLGFTT